MSFVGFDIHDQALGYLECRGKRANYRVINIKFPADIDICGVVGSENGLICLTVKTKYNGIPGYTYPFTSSPDEPLYICNPITKERVILPRKLINMEKSVDGVHIVHGFGYHPVTNEYKVVRICYIGDHKSPSFKGQVEVYTLGSDTGWQRAGEIKYYIRPKYLRDLAGVCINGALHWLCETSSAIVVFDLTLEKFYLLRTPNTLSGYQDRRIFVMRRCLCIEYFGLFSLEVWFLKKDREEGNSSSDHMNEQYYKSWSWSREFSIPLEGRYSTFSFSSNRRFSTFSIARMGEILLTNGREIVCCSDPKFYSTKTMVLEFNDERSNWNVPLSHINSFVTLEALGEKNVKKFVAEKRGTIDQCLLQA